MEVLSYKMKSMGDLFKRRSSVTKINITPELHKSNSATKSAAVDLQAELYDAKKKIEEKDLEIQKQQDMLKDYISHRINISRDLPISDQIDRLKRELANLGYQEPVTIRPSTPPVSMEEHVKLQNEVRHLVNTLESTERNYKSRIYKLKTAHAEEIATLNLDIFELKDQLKNQNRAAEEPATDTRLIIELSTQVSILSTEIEELQKRLSKYEK